MAYSLLRSCNIVKTASVGRVSALGRVLYVGRVNAICFESHVGMAIKSTNGPS